MISNIVADTNFLLDIYIFNNPISSELFELLKDENFIFYRTEETLAELEDVLRRPQFQLSENQINSILCQWTNNSQELKTVAECSVKCRDIHDQKFLNLAFSLTPSFLITKDKDLLKVKSKAGKTGVNIIEPEHLLRLLKSN